MKNIFKDENWKELHLSNAIGVSYQRIYVSDFGRIRIRDYKEETFRFVDTFDENGHLVFAYKIKNGFNDLFHVHRAVALAFVKQKNQDYIFVVHKDYNLHNNYYKNLKWVDYKGLDKFHQEREMFYNEEKYREVSAKLSREQVREIKNKLDKDSTYGALTKLAKIYQVSPSQISKIKLGKSRGYLNEKE